LPLNEGLKPFLKAAWGIMTMPHLNNRREQDHRGVKQRYYPMRGFGNYDAAARFCRAFDEQRNYFRARAKPNEAVSLAEQRLLFRQRFAALQEMLLAAWSSFIPRSGTGLLQFRSPTPDSVRHDLTKPAGCYIGTPLWREIQAQGYGGSRKMVAVWVQQQRQVARAAGVVLPPTTGRPPQARLPARPRDVTPQQVSYLFIARPAQLTAAEQAVVAQVRERVPHLKQIYALSQGFVRLVRERTGPELDAWLGQARAQESREIQNFAAGIDNDKEAIALGLTQRWSNGPVEGQVNRLKCLKRQMYGRAKFDLLRRRVLADP
jgi:transposase